MTSLYFIYSILVGTTAGYTQGVRRIPEALATLIRVALRLLDQQQHLSTSFLPYIGLSSGVERKEVRNNGWQSRSESFHAVYREAYNPKRKVAAALELRDID
ncbi:hypothetical protein FS837_007880 [Tulasnella sp. UAMH 9824]|nr:hypothetical protein FS837_007880 [Tulasnella sp. UAMH 9824]